MSELSEIRERTHRIEILLEGFISESKIYRSFISEKIEKAEQKSDKQDDRIKALERKFWQFSGGMTVLVALWEIFKTKLFK